MGDGLGEHAPAGTSHSSPAGTRTHQVSPSKEGLSLKQCILAKVKVWHLQRQPGAHDGAVLMATSRGRGRCMDGSSSITWWLLIDIHSIRALGPFFTHLRQVSLSFSRSYLPVAAFALLLPHLAFQRIVPEGEHSLPPSTELFQGSRPCCPDSSFLKLQ